MDGASTTGPALLAAAPRRDLRLLLLVPFVAVAVVALLQLPWAPLGDDWKLYVDFHGMAARKAVLVNTTAEEGRRFRPVCYLLVWLEQSYLGLPFALSKAIGLGFLAWAGASLAGLLRRLGAARLTAVLVGTLYCLHPALAEVHGWASTRVDQMAAAFALAALCMVLDRRPLLAGLLWLAAFGSKEAAYPLLVAAPLLSGRLRDLVPPGLAFAAIMIWKLRAVGVVTGGLWGLILQVPLHVQLQGWLGYLGPWLLYPRSSAAPGPAVTALALAWGVVLLTTLVAPLVRGLQDRGGSGRRPRRLRVDPRLRLLALAALCLVVTGGVPYPPDLAGGRLWTLPLAFALGAALLRARPGRLLALCLLSLPLLHANLAPYREADRIMADTLAVLAREVPAHDGAVRIHGLPDLHGPVPLFALMPDVYMRGFDEEGRPTEDRPLVTTADMESADPEGWVMAEQRWRAFQDAADRKIAYWRWDPAAGRVRRY
ncbi:MAG: hypothetical protein R3F30_01805 [Planctomycetota bacterium]